MLAARWLPLPAVFGYKGHSRPTAYLGGAAVMAGFFVIAIPLAQGLNRFDALLLCALGVWAIGTVLPGRIGGGQLLGVGGPERIGRIREG